MKVDFNHGYRPPRLLDYAIGSIESGQTHGNGEYGQKSERLLEGIMGGKALLTTSCTHALEMTCQLLDITAGDEIICPSFTFVSTANAYVLFGAVPRFVDIDPATLNIDPAGIEAAITPRTRAIVIVHYAGVGCDMEAIMAIAQRHKIPVIEDNAHGLFGSYRGKPLGSFGTFATQSFHSTKNFSCGEGGALIVNDPQYIDRAEILREKGTNRSQFFKGVVDKYSWVDIGSSYVMSDVLASMLLAQLEHADFIQQSRKESWDFYYEKLASWASKHGIQMPTVPEDREQAYHMFYLLMPSEANRDSFIVHMRDHQITAPFHYVPLHTSTFVENRFSEIRYDCPVTEDVSARLVRLPLYTNMEPAALEHVLSAMLEWSPS